MKYKDLYRRILPYVGITVVVIVFTIATKGKILSLGNLNAILEQMMVMCLISIGYIFTMTTGALDYTVGSTYALASIIVAVVAKNSPWLALLAAMITGLVLSTLNGAIIAKFRVPSSIIGLSMMFALRGVVQFIVAKGGSYAIPLSMHKLKEGWLRLFVLVIMLIIGAYLFIFNKFGWRLRAVGSGQLVSRFSGVNVEKIRISAFMFSGLCVGCAAFIGMLRSGTAGATTGGSLGLNVLLAMVMGGMSISGGFSSSYLATVIGCAFITILSSGLVMIEVDVATQQLLKGVIFILTVALTVDRTSTKRLKQNKREAKAISVSVEGNTNA